MRIPVNNNCIGYYIRWYFNGWHYWMFYPGSQVVNTEGQDYNIYSDQKVYVGSANLTLNQITALRTILKSYDVWVLSGTEWRKVSIEPGSQVVYRNEVLGYEMELVISSSITIQLSTAVETGMISTLTDDSLSTITNDGLEIIYL